MTIQAICGIIAIVAIVLAVCGLAYLYKAYSEGPHR